MEAAAQRNPGGSALGSLIRTLKTVETTADTGEDHEAESAIDNTLEQRLSTIIAKRRLDINTINTLGNDGNYWRQTAHNILVVEILRLSEKVVAAVAELNDRMRGTDIWLNIAHIEHTLTCEKVYKISLAATEDSAPSLILTVDWDGNLGGLLKSHWARTLLHSYTVFSVSTQDITEMLVTLLECHYH
jgi:hypothetical protein